jgi:hypothetical protein
MTDTTLLPEGRLFNTPLECGLRLLFVLNASRPAKYDLQRLISYDYLLVHSGDVDDSPRSLHPAVPFRGSEWLVKRDVIRAGLDLMFSRELIAKLLDRDGISYAGTELTSAFVALLKVDYAMELATRAEWVISRFGGMNDRELEDFMTINIGRWGAEFENLAALKDLELE